MPPAKSFPNQDSWGQWASGQPVTFSFEHPHTAQDTLRWAHKPPTTSLHALFSTPMAQTPFVLPFCHANHGMALSPEWELRAGWPPWPEIPEPGHVPVPCGVPPASPPHLSSLPGPSSAQTPAFSDRDRHNTIVLLSLNVAAAFYLHHNRLGKKLRTLAPTTPHHHDIILTRGKKSQVWFKILQHWKSINLRLR